MLVTLLTIWGITKLFSIGAAPFHIPTNSLRKLLFFTSWPRFVVFHFLDYRHSSECEVVFHCISQSIRFAFPKMTNDVEQLFMCLLAICRSSLKIYLDALLIFFFIGLSFYCLVIWVLYHTLFRYTFCKYFLLSCGLAFHFLDYVLRHTKLLILMKSNLSIFHLVLRNHMSVLRNCNVTKGHKDLYLCFLLVVL